MLKKSITYTDIDDETVTEEHYFNLTKSELIEMELNAEGGSLAALLQGSVDGQDAAMIVKLVKEMILAAYGVRNGKKFVKTQEIRDEFEHSEAYDSLFSELVTKEGASTDFMLGIIPKDLRAQAITGTPAIDTVELPKKSPNEMSREELLEAFKNKSSL